MSEWDKDFFNRSPENGDIIVFPTLGRHRAAEIRVAIVLNEEERVARSLRIKFPDLMPTLATRNARISSWDKVIVINPLTLPEGQLAMLEDFYDAWRNND